MRHRSEETNWQRLGSVVARLKSEVERARSEGEDEAGAAHDDPTPAEWWHDRTGRRNG